MSLKKIFLIKEAGGSNYITSEQALDQIADVVIMWDKDEVISSNDAMVQVSDIMYRAGRAQWSTGEPGEDMDEAAMPPSGWQLSEPELVEVVGHLQDLYYEVKPKNPEQASALNKAITYLTADVRRRNK